MRILELTWEYPPHVVGGVGTHIAALAPMLAHLGNNVTLVTPLMGGTALESADGLTVQRVETAPWLDDLLSDVQQTNARMTSFVAQLIEGGAAFDVIHAHDWLVCFAAIALKQQYKLPLLATIHATERGRWRGYLGGDPSRQIADAEWQMTFEAWRVITPSRSMANEIHNYFKLPANKIDVIPNGIDTRTFDALDGDPSTARYQRRSGQTLSDFRAQYAPPDAPLVFSVGRLTYEKGAHVLIEAVPRVLAQHPTTTFVIAGTGAMGDGLKERVNELNVSESVRFVGFISDEERNKLYKVATCAVFPSLYEPFGIVALEAMAATCPLVVASTGGLAEVVQHHVTGVTVYPNSADSLADGILHVLDHPNWARERAQVAYQRVVQKFNWREIAERTLRVMERIVEERKSADW